jgi:hypothetical protein
MTGRDVERRGLMDKRFEFVPYFFQARLIEPSSGMADVDEPVTLVDT